MEDERWAKQDKLNQLRGVVGLCNNAKSNNKEKITTLAKKQSKEIKNLNTQNKKYRQQYEEVLKGDKRNLLPVLNDHPQMDLAFKRLNPKQIEEELKQSIFCKNKKLDRLRFKRKTLEQEFLNKKLELAELQKEAEDAPENYPWEQEISNKIQSTSVKLNAARTNRQVYERARNILKNDAIRHNEILDGLKGDLAHQCECIVKAVEMGQRVSEELSMLQNEYQDTEKSVRENMRQRDRAIREIRAKLENIRHQGPTGARLSPVEPQPSGHTPEHFIGGGSEDNLQESMDLHVKREIWVIEGTLKEIKEAAAVHRVEDIVPRIDEQKRQNVRLTKQVKENEEQLNKMLDLHNQLDVMREVVMYHTMTDEAIRIKEERHQLREDINAEREDLDKAKEELVGMGQKIVDVRAALLSMNMMLDTVYVDDGSDADFMDLNEEIDMTPGETLQPLSQPDTEALTLMELVMKKVQWLIEQAAYVSALPTQDHLLYNLDYGVSKAGAEDDADKIVSNMLEDLEEMEDSSVLTRKDIKAESQRLVDLHNDPRSMFQQSTLPKFRKHKCF